MIYEMLLRGYTTSDIVHYAAEKTDWNVSRRTVEEYIRRAREDVARISDEEKEAALGSSLKRLDMLYRKALKKDDLKTALAIQKEINELFHLKDTEQKSDNVINITFQNKEDKFL